MLDKNFWRKYFKVYDVLNLCIPYQELLKTVIEELEIHPDELILDAGSGTGNLAIEIKKRGGRVIALDYSEEALEIHLEKDKEAVVVQHDLVQDLNFPDNHFDKIVSVNTLFCFGSETKEKIIREFYRIIKPNGKIVLVNLLKGFNPLKIYFHHFKRFQEEKGILSAIIQFVELILPSLKMLYYANKIRKTDNQTQNFFDYSEQRELLKKAGFKSISESKMIYSNQAVFNSALK